MRPLLRPTSFALGLAAALAAAAADAPTPPILKPAATVPGTARVRIPITGDATTPYRIAARVPRKGKTGDPVEIVVAINTGARAVATTKMLKSWGYTPGPDKKVTLTELVLIGQRVVHGPKAAKGKEGSKEPAHDVIAHVPHVVVEAIDEVAEKTDKVLGSDLILGLHDLTRHQDRSADPRLYFTDKLLEINFPTAMVKKSADPMDPVAEPAGSTDAKWAAVFAPLSTRAGPVFNHASFNGIDAVKNRSGLPQPVNVGVTAATTLPTGVIMSVGMSHALGLKLDPDKATQDFLTITRKGKFVPTTVAEMRITVMTGKGPVTSHATPMELVIKDLAVVVDTTESDPMVWVGPNFINKYFPDAVYTTAPAGAADPLRLYGRVSPEMLEHPARAQKKPGK